MSVKYKHKRHFEIHEFYGDDSTRVARTFTGTTAEAYAAFSFSSAWNTSSPTKTLAFENSNKTLVVTYEFNNKSDQDAFKTAVDNGYDAGNAWASDLPIKHTKTEWLHQDGSVSASSTDIVVPST
jgi:hypothetical protein